MAVKTASEMTYIVLSGALNSTPTNSTIVAVTALAYSTSHLCHFVFEFIFYRLFYQLHVI